MKPNPAAAPLELETLPGHYIRRLQQIAVALFMEESEDFGVTPVQFAALNAVARAPGMDQRTLARTIGFDTSTIGGVVDRLERQGLLLRGACEHDRRVRLLSATPAGLELLARMSPRVQAAQQRILAPLAGEEREDFMRLLRKLVDASNGLSRAPRAAAPDEGG